MVSIFLKWEQGECGELQTSQSNLVTQKDNGAYLYGICF